MKFLNLSFTPDTIEPVDIVFGGWSPDAEELNNPGSLEALNVIPLNGIYAPWREFFPFPGAQMPDFVFNGRRIYGFTTAGNKNDIRAMFGGKQGIYEVKYNFTTDTFSIVTRLLLSQDEWVDRFYPWAFSQFGRFLVVHHHNCTMRYIDISDPDASFAPIENSPTALASARIGDILMAIGADDPYIARWSAFDNIFLPWETDPATQSDFQPFPVEYGALTCIVGGFSDDTGVLFQERAIWVASYVGVPGVFDFRLVETQRGAIGPNAAAAVGSLIYYLSEDGVYVFNGTESKPVGDGRVNEYIRRTLDWQTRLRTQVAIDVQNGLVAWLYPSLSDINDSRREVYPMKELLIYSYKDNKFTHANVSMQALIDTNVFPELGERFFPSLENLPTTPPFANLDTDTISLDDIWRNTQRPILGGVEEYGFYGMFVGANAEATIDTAEYTAPGGLRVFVNAIHPIVDVARPMCRAMVFSKDQFASGWIRTESYTDQEIDGSIPVLGEGRFVRFRLVIPRNVYWNAATGVSVQRTSQGKV